MASLAAPLRRDPFGSDTRDFDLSLAKSAPTSASTIGGGDAMDVSQPQISPMGPPTSSPVGDRSEQQQGQNDQHATTPNGGAQPTGAAAAAQQPKIVQTAFIHKLYNMLEDQSIQHLISWSSTNESFVMSPSSEFSKVLAQYFKHTNISSFVRQLNMYGFHKVSDVFHTGSPDSPLWEFKHGAGNFKRGDLVGLREIKRRASRHALIHRESFPSAPKMSTPQPPGPGTTMDPMPDPFEARLNVLEWNAQELHARLARTEDAYAAVTSKCHTLLEGLARCHHWNNELSSHLLTIIPDPENPVNRDVAAMRQDISRHLEQLRSEDHESPFVHKPSFFQPSNMPQEQPVPMSPRQRPFDESRRPSLQGLPGLAPRPGGVRAAMPTYLQPQMSPRRYGSIGTGNGTYSPSSNRPNYPAPPPPQLSQHSQQQQHPLATTSSPPSNTARRHTSADIRLQGWEGGQPPSQYGQGNSPYASGQSSSAWPSSPRAVPNSGDQQIRDALAQYELPRVAHPSSSRQHSPAPHDSGPPSFNNSFGPSYANSNDAGWQIPGPRFPFRGLETPGPPTRRSSMASNVHSLLNPADTAEREGEDEGSHDERKRKRML